MYTDFVLIISIVTTIFTLNFSCIIVLIKPIPLSIFFFVLHALCKSNSFSLELMPLMAVVVVASYSDCIKMPG